MTTFVDSSAFFAVISPDDRRHESAVAVWRRLLHEDRRLVTSSYVLIETICLTHARLGTGIVLEFLTDIVPIVEVAWADVRMHTAAVTAMLAHPGRSGPSLVDCMSFEVIRQRRIEDAFAYDPHFEGRGFNVIG